MTFLNLVDNYAPLSLAVYSIYFKANAFDLYFLAMQQVWLMYYSFNRRHYNKAPLIWLANIAYWQQGAAPSVHTTSLQPSCD